MTEDEKKLTAYHEGRSCNCCSINEDAKRHPIHKATIIPRGRALRNGYAAYQRRDQLSTNKRTYFKAQLAIAMGGRVAEEMIFGEDKVTTGASSRILIKQLKEQGPW